MQILSLIVNMENSLRLQLKLLNKRSIQMKKTITYQKSMNRDKRQLCMMALPGMLLVLIFSYIPMIGIILAFKNFNPNLGIFGSKWVGLDNFRFFFNFYISDE